jgi:hypothetical protein
MNDHPAPPAPALPGTSAPNNGKRDVRYATYRVTVRNELTGDSAVIEWESTSKEDAKVEVLHMLFRSRSWRKTKALVPEVVEADWAA